jgi:CheY-like chemotaxis protein
MSKEIATVLLIDDDPIIDFLHRKLIAKAGIVAPTITHYNGKTAIEELIELNNKLSPNDTVLALLDVNMPVLDGWGFLDELKLIHPTLKFKLELFMLSSSNNPDDIRKSKKNPFVKDYLIKPLSIENIVKYFF